MQVVLAANELPSINDVTYSELFEIIAKVMDPFSTFVFYSYNLLFDASYSLTIWLSNTTSSTTS